MNVGGFAPLLKASAREQATWLHDMNCRTVLVDLAVYAPCFTTHDNHICHLLTTHEASFIMLCAHRHSLR